MAHLYHQPKKALRPSDSDAQRRAYQTRACERHDPEREDVHLGGAEMTRCRALRRVGNDHCVGRPPGLRTPPLRSRTALLMRVDPVLQRSRWDWLKDPSGKSTLTNLKASADRLAWLVAYRPLMARLRHSPKPSAAILPPKPAPTILPL